MKILFDHQMFSLQRYGGISRYFAGISSGINTIAGMRSAISVLYTENEYLKNRLPVFNNKLGDQIFAGKRDLIYKWNKKFSKRYMKLGNYDVLHPTYFDNYFTTCNKKPLVITVHDMIYESQPSLFPDSGLVIEQKRQAIASAHAIIAISEHTRQDVIRLYPEAEKRITVVHHGYSLQPTATTANLKLPEKYLLFVGERWHYKNFTLFIKAISPLLQQDHGLYLVCAGGGTYLPDEKKLFNDLGIATRCIQFNATDAGLKQLYSQALAFIFPSLHEGFGLPILEAFANNCPVACSNSTALPEVAGNAALYFDPHNQHAIQAAVSQLINNADLRQQLKTSGKQRLAQFTFDSCVQQTAKVYQSIASS